MSVVVALGRGGLKDRRSTRHILCISVLLLCYTINSRFERRFRVDTHRYTLQSRTVKSSCNSTTRDGMWSQKQTSREPLWWPPVCLAFVLFLLLRPARSPSSNTLVGQIQCFGSNSRIMDNLLPTLPIHTPTLRKAELGIPTVMFITFEALRHRRNPYPGVRTQPEGLEQASNARLVGSRLDGCLERLAELSHAMNDINTTFQWAAIFLAWSLKVKDRLATMKAIRYLGDIFGAQDDADTALHLFEVALEGVTLRLMGVHGFKGECMVRMSSISENRRDIDRSRGEIEWVDLKLDTLTSP
ncbi:hypothetical protein FB451DRAFT_1178050 [Mycena latifolia]|nr:hypothetical protein FB451DRAFT_1178050 [Mycena latifolia]